MAESGEKAFRNVPDSPAKTYLISAFYTSMLVHGLVRIVAARDLKNANLRLVAIFSYFVEMFQAARLYSQGALSLPEGAPFLFAPLGVIVALVLYKDKDEN